MIGTCGKWPCLTTKTLKQVQINIMFASANAAHVSKCCCDMTQSNRLCSGSSGMQRHTCAALLLIRCHSLNCTCCTCTVVHIIKLTRNTSIAPVPALLPLVQCCPAKCCDASTAGRYFMHLSNCWLSTAATLESGIVACDCCSPEADGRT